MSTAVTIHTAFSARLSKSSLTCSLHHPNEELLSNGEMLSEIRRHLHQGRYAEREKAL